MAIHVFLKSCFFVQDMTDYDDIRFCCTGADICLKCWPLMTIAIKVVDAALRGLFFDFLGSHACR